jgi:drug/metabolite transporter (DMT)-like permease
MVIAMGILDTLAWIFYSYAVFNNNMSVITAITESYPAIGMALGFFINKEKIRWYQWLGGAIALVASLSLIFLV